MNTYEVMRLLRQRHGRWIKERFRSVGTGRPDFINGVIRGLAEAVEIARQCHERGTRRTRRSGFTLIELMIVVAIIGILAAIAVPQFAQMARKSKEATTKGNLATLRAVIALAYTNNEGKYPTDDLSSLVPTYLSVIPWKDTPPYHPPGNQVSAGNMASQLASRGDWFYDNDESETQFGTVQINCVHQDMKGNAWTMY